MFVEVELIPDMIVEEVNGNVKLLKEYYCPFIKTLSIYPEFLNAAV